MSTGIDFVIGGKDNATSAMDKVDQALGRLQARTGKLAEATKTMAVNVTGAKSTMSGLSTGAAAVEKATKATSTQIAGLSASLAKLKAAAGPLLAVYAAVKTVTAGVGAIKDSATAYDEQAESIRGLESALASGIGPAAGMSEKLQQAAAGLESLTGISERSTLAMMKQASHLGVHSGQIDEVTKAAVGLAEVTGKGLPEALSMSAAAVKGDFSAFTELIPQIHMATTAEQKLLMVQQLSAKGLDLKAKQSGSLSAVMAQTSNSVRRLMESIGALLAPMRLLIATGVKALADALRTALAPAVERANEMVKGLGAVAATIGDTMRAVGQVVKVALEGVWRSIKAVGSAAASALGIDFTLSAKTFATAAEKMRAVVTAAANKIIAAITWVEVVATNLGKVWEGVKAFAELQLLRLTEIVKHALTKVIPAYVNWFVDAFETVISNAFSRVVRIVANAMTNIAEAVVRGWDFITSRGKGGIEKLVSDMNEITSRSLTEGFKATVAELPEIAARQITEREQQLSEKVGKIGENLGKQFTDKFNARMVKLGDDVGEKLSKDINLRLNADVIHSRPQLQATEGRLLTRGPVEKREQFLEAIERNTKDVAVRMQVMEAQIVEISSATGKTADNTAKRGDEIQLVGVAD